MATTNVQRNRQPTQRVTSKIPDFRSDDEAAEFWDTHDSADFEDQFEDVSDIKMIGLRRDGILQLWLEPELAAKLTELAAGAGTTPAWLAQRWVLDQLDKAGDDAE